MSGAPSDGKDAAVTSATSAATCRVLCSAILVGALACTLPASARADDELSTSHAAPDPPTVTERLARALAYEHGEGLPQDQLLAAALYCETAQSGNAEAAFRLGWMYVNGRGVPHDDGIAAALFDLAADQGHAYARAILGRLGDVHGTLPDCMRPPEPPLPEPVVTDDTDYGPDSFEDLPPYKKKIADLVNRIAPRYGIEPRLALAVIAVESNFNALARSVKEARGLMQLIPETAARFNVRNPFDMTENMRGGLSYLRWLLAYYRGDIRLAAAAYNAGEGVVDRYRGVPPYPETRDYVKRVTQLFRGDRHPYNPQVAEPSSIVARSNANPM